MFFGLVALVVLLDQVSKIAVLRFMYQGESITLIPSVLSLTCVYNSGAAFGLFAQKSGILTAIVIIMTIGVIIGYFKLSIKRGLVVYGAALIIGGALGNLLDRVRLGYVVDFVDFHFWPVFNIADSAIVVGAGLLLIDLWLKHRSEKRMESNA